MQAPHYSPGFDDLVKDLKSVAGWQQLGPELAQITPGRWDHLISWAARHGYRFTLTDIRQRVSKNPRILSPQPPGSPWRDWTVNTLWPGLGR